MNYSAKTCLVVAVLITLTNLCAGQKASAGGGSGWGWAKPMNKRLGAFYTSNKNANFSRSSSNLRGSAYSSGGRTHSAHGTIIQPPVAVPHFHVIQPLQATNQAFAPKAMVHSPVEHLPIAPAVVSGSSSVPLPSQSPAVNPGSASHKSALPFRSTTTTFWQ